MMKESHLRVDFQSRIGYSGLMKRKERTVMIDLLWQDFATTQVTAITAQGDEREAARLELKAIAKKIRKLEKKNGR